jgi:HlyD family secretion protein
MTPAAKTGANPQQQDLASLLGDAAGAPWWRRGLYLGLALVAAVLAGTLWQMRSNAAARPVFITEAVRRGDIVLTVSANGSLQPTRSVSIGSELSGTVARVLVDVNDRVLKGQVLVELDAAKLRDQVARAQAALAMAEAAVALAAATRAEAGELLARQNAVRRLSGGKAPSDAELATSVAALARARASEASAHAGVSSARAALATDSTNLAKASIRAPIDGVILSRNVDPGNAVAASLQAVTLFVLAEDLRRLRLQVNLDEADVGAVREGQRASFTVSAYPERQYPAAITRVAFGSSIADNVVTYLALLDVDNADLSLRPGMSASAHIRAAERHDVLLVPNSALRFTPSAERRAAPGIVQRLMPRMPGRAARRPGADASAARQVWVLRNGAPVALEVRAGMSDGRMTQVQDGPLQEGMQVITDQGAAAP